MPSKSNNWINCKPTLDAATHWHWYIVNQGYNKLLKAFCALHDAPLDKPVLISRLLMSYFNCKWSKLVWEWVSQHGARNDSPTTIRIIPAVAPPNIITIDMCIDLASYSTYEQITSTKDTILLVTLLRIEHDLLLNVNTVWFTALN